MNTKYVRANYEVQVSEDGEKWYGAAAPSRHPDTAEGLQQAESQMAALLRHTPYVRVARVERHTEVLSSLRNGDILTNQQIADLIMRATTALAGLPGIRINEGCDVSFGVSHVVHSPPRVSVSFDAKAILGAYPSIHGLKFDEASYAKRKQERREWNERAEKLLLETLAEAGRRLQAAGICYTRSGQAIHLKP